MLRRRFAHRPRRLLLLAILVHGATVPAACALAPAEPTTEAREEVLERGPDTALESSGDTARALLPRR